MKIKATKSFVSGVFSAKPGEILDLPERRGRKLISLGFASAVKEKTPKAPAATGAAPDSASPGKSEETAAPKKKPARRASAGV